MNSRSRSVTPTPGASKADLLADNKFTDRTTPTQTHNRKDLCCNIQTVTQTLLPHPNSETKQTHTKCRLTRESVHVHTLS